LIDDLLDTSRIATGKLHFEPRPTDLNTVVRAAIDTVRASAATKNIQIEEDLSPTSLVVMGEPVRLQQIAWNLLSNAIKFTGTGGIVRVKTEPVDGLARLVVTDSGIGISPEFLPHVFDRFRQADGSTSRQHGGLGLGLAIAHALAKLHVGKLEVKSDGPDTGAEFSLSLALVQGAEVVEESIPLKSLSLSGLDVLIVEDSADTLALLNSLFTHEGAKVTSISSATEALKAVKAHKPHLIISDIGMPEIDGYTFLREVRAMPGLEEVPAIAISGYASEDDRKRALSAGYFTLIPKPIDLELLFGLIQEMGLTALPAS
jgi:CheY-like chemotaxis protein